MLVGTVRKKSPTVDDVLRRVVEVQIPPTASLDGRQDRSVGLSGERSNSRIVQKTFPFPPTLSFFKND